MGYAASILFGLFAVSMMLNVPIAIALGTASLALILIEGSIPLSLFIQTTFGSSDSFPLIAIPFFILAGDIMSSGGMARRLVDFIHNIVGSLTGGLGIITILASFIFAAISGSGAATVASIGGIMIPYMMQRGYKDSYAAALAASAGSLGPIVPPSIVFILYGIIANVSIGDMFIAGIIPGAFIAVALLIINYVISKKEGYVGLKKSERNGQSFWKSLNEAKYALLAPVLILGGIYGGVVTPTEAAVVAVVYSLIICVFVYKEFAISQIPEVFMKSAVTSGSILIFVSTASFFGKVMAVERIPQFITDSIGSLTTNPIIILILINIFLLVVGMFMETVAAVLIFVPLLLPIVLPLGIDPIHFGMIVCVNLTLGLLTPPLGINIFIGSNIAKIPFEKTFKYLIPIFVSLFIVLGLITFIPELTLFLPEMLKE